MPAPARRRPPVKKMTAALLATTISWLFFNVAALAPWELEKF